MPGFSIGLIVLILILLSASIRIIKQYEKGVVFRLGKIRGSIKEPGICFIIPIIDNLRKIGMRTVTLPVDSQKVITKDNVSIDVAAVAYYQVSDAIKSVVEIEDVLSAIYQIAQTTVRNVVGQNVLDDVLSQTIKINESIKAILDKTTEKWGVYVSMVELKDIQLPTSMQSAMSAAAQAEREKRAKIIAAEGEELSAAALAKAADVISKHPIALQLRNLQVLSEISSDKNSTIIFPAQFMDTVASVKQFMSKEVK
ncbi:MAG TPA: SPFH domain-containing protein [Candidatus Saccharimonadales bacterium]|nr:SPFH domain-containing protein [Candidatus Saccharimonadales bacterium]